jgi:hypothetical protein
MAEDQRLYGFFGTTLPDPGAESWQPVRISARGEVAVIDFYHKMAMEGRCYQVRAGTIATGLAADSTLTDTASQMCVDAASGLTIIPAELGVSIVSIATALLLSVKLKAVGAASTAGTAFVPLPMRQGGAGASSTARAMTDGGVTVAAEVATTTRVLFEAIDNHTQTPTTALGHTAMVTNAAVSWQPRIPYIGDGVACVYLQVASTTAFNLHYAHLNYVELATASVL